jgi:hypothetical protein
MGRNLRSKVTNPKDVKDAKPAKTSQSKPRKPTSSTSLPKNSDEDNEASTSGTLQTDQPSKQPIASSTVKKTSPATMARPTTRSQATEVKDGANAEDVENAKHSENVEHTTDTSNPHDANLAAPKSNPGAVPQHHIIAPDGDLTIETSKGSTVLVSSAVLTQASDLLGDIIKGWRNEPATTKSPI